MTRAAGCGTARPAAGKLLLVCAAFLLLLMAMPARAAASILYDYNGSIYVMKDDGSGGGLLVNGGTDPGVNPHGSTVVFAANGGHSVAKWTPGGAVTVLDSHFPGTAVGPEPEINGNYLFEAYSGYTAKIREGSLTGGGSTELSLAQQPPPASTTAPDGWDSFGWGPYVKAKDPSPSPVADEFLYDGPKGRRCGSAGCGTVKVEERPLVMLKSASADALLLVGPDLWDFTESSWSPDGASIVFILYRGSSLYDPPQHGEGIYVANADGTNARQVFQGTEVYNDGAYSHPRLTADGRIIFEYQNPVTGPNGILSVPVSCNACTITNATYLAAGHNPAWTAVPITPSSRPPAQEHELTVTVNGTGHGTVNGGGIRCPPTCRATVSHNTTVSLSATAAAGSRFAGWGGACSGTRACSMILAADRAVTARFDLIDRADIQTGQHLKTALSRGLRLTVVCGSKCTAAATPTIDGPLARRVGLIPKKGKLRAYRIGTGTLRSGSGNRTLTIRFASRAQKALRNQRAVKLNIQVNCLFDSPFRLVTYRGTLTLRR